jgi:hypothetical protein
MVGGRLGDAERPRHVDLPFAIEQPQQGPPIAGVEPGQQLVLQEQVRVDGGCEDRVGRPAPAPQGIRPRPRHPEVLGLGQRLACSGRRRQGARCRHPVVVCRLTDPDPEA